MIAVKFAGKVLPKYIYVCQA